MTHSPPNGWGCSCFVIGARTIAGAVRVGGKPGNSLPDGWRSPQPKTGTPPGIDKGWDHAPGASVAEMVTSMVQKPVNWDFSLAVAYMRNVPEPNRDAFSRGYRELPSVATEMRLYVERVRDEQNGAAFALKVRVEPQRTLGLATNQQTREIERLTGLSLKGDLYDFAVDRDAVRHIFDRHSNAVIEASRGQRAVTPDDFARLGLLLNAPDTMGSGDTISRRGPIIRMTRRFGDETLVTLFEVRTGRRRLALVTMWVELARPRP
ncbi:MAG: hypothetical protein U1D35_11280 [Paracoccaceae bacterium]|nr:hypothetical protein [Paracoccaceae bacterium]